MRITKRPYRLLRSRRERPSIHTAEESDDLVPVSAGIKSGLAALRDYHLPHVGWGVKNRPQCNSSGRFTPIPDLSKCSN
jgi:hypothetical protein